MSNSKITLFSFAQWMQMNERDLFSEMLLPDGVDKEILTDNILLRGGEFEVVYSEPNFMQSAIGSWSKKWYRTFTKWVEALAIEYNPLENYDRMEDYTDTTNRGLTSSGRKDSGNTRTFDNEDKETRDISDERTYNNTDEKTLDTSNVLDGTVEEKVSAYDSSSYQPSRNTDTDNTTTDTGTITDAHTGTVTDAGTGTDTFNHTGTITDEYGEGVSGSEKENTTAKHTGRLHGNIGVTTSQQMLEAELDIAKWNLYEHITDIFLEEFIIPIYS